LLFFFVVVILGLFGRDSPARLLGMSQDAEDATVDGVGWWFSPLCKWVWFEHKWKWGTAAEKQWQRILTLCPLLTVLQIWVWIR